MTTFFTSLSIVFLTSGHLFFSINPVSRVRLYGIVASEVFFWDIENTTKEVQRFAVEIARLQHLIADTIHTVIGADSIPIGHVAIGNYPFNDVRRFLSQSIVS